MPIPSAEQATKYVRRLEAEWGLKTSHLDARETVDEDVPDSAYRQVETNNNLWAVWVEDDGMIYGEC